MKSFMHCAAASLAALVLSGNAVAASQTIYRCGDSYSQTPCANGSVVQADDARDDAQRSQAQSALQRDKALVKDMEATRRKEAAQEQALNKAALARARAAHVADDTKSEPKPAKETTPKKTSSKRTAQAKKEETGVFTATVPGQKPKKKTRKSATAKP